MTRIAPAVVRYGLSLLAVAAVVGFNFALGLREHFSTPFFLAAVAGCAWYGGLGCGLVATVASALVLDFFFVGKEFAFDFDATTWVWLLVFMAVAIFLNILAESQRRLLAALRVEDQRKTQFLGILAHELRNFLSPVSTAVAVISMGSHQDETKTEMCRVIERQIENMNRLVGDLLDGARIAQGKLQLHLEQLDGREALSNAIDTVQPLMIERAHHLKVDLPEQPLTIEADRVRIEQIFVNLLTNAAKYTDPNGSVWVAAERDADDMVVRIRDNGKGISEELLPSLFNLFVQAEPGSRGGLGIGLNLVQRLVHLHGGAVSASSPGLGLGSEFTVRLPVSTAIDRCEQDVAASQRIDSRSIQTKSSTGRAVKI
jgi:signal transduction histidine kinase